MLSLNKHTEKLNLKLKPTLILKTAHIMCVSLSTTVVHNTAQNSFDNFPSYPPDNHHNSDLMTSTGGERNPGTWR